MKAFCKYGALVLSVVAFCSLGFAQNMTVDQVLKKMEQVSASTPMIQANIQRTKFWDITGNTDDPQVGKVWISQSGTAPRQVKVDLTKPVREIFLLNKGTALHFNPGKTGDEFPVKKDDQAEGECVMFGLCQAGPRIKQYYDISLVGQQETVDGSKTTHLRLKPKDPKHPAGITSIELWLDNTTWYTVQTRVTETNKNTITAKFSSFQTTKIASSEFNVDTKGTEITKHK